ncbi:MAG: TonB-dependent receptor [Candidatus Pedobacter colombiensis]|uniref:TonB-dependent receptor n=1 Tax=Candidatus Pedobacter colombiensis TaxID=3121371 RepID=A0AAJ5WBM2_9SPHI|nr:TonB-dependent receptor [Pedobacter sp.]WEK21043.1 MAG: TonB-dependent receptor [Pedobacter sp.]
MKHFYHLSRFLLLFLCILYSLNGSAQAIKGKVTDAVTKEPIVGTSVLMKENGKVEFVQLDGNFNFKHVKQGDYQLEFHYLSYRTKKVKVSVNPKKTTYLSVELESNTEELKAVTIAGDGGSTDKRSRTLEKDANQLVNIVSSRNIELSPDITVANVMQRISGVTIERSSSGEGRYPIIRGMEKRYINTLVNGIKIPSPDNKNRFIPLDLFPAELLERIEVSKTLIPSMEGDAIGGTINLVMKDAPAKTLFNVNFTAGYNTVFADRPFSAFSRSSIDKLSPSELNGNNYRALPSDFPTDNLNFSNKSNPINTNLGVTFGSRFGKDNRFGFIVSGSYQNNYTGNNSLFFLPNAHPGVNNVPQFPELQARSYSQQSRRLGLNSKLDYKINDKNKISLINVFVRLDDYQSRMISDTIALSSLVDGMSRSKWQYQSIYNATLQGNHQLLKSTKVDWSLAYSDANNHIPDQAEFIHEFPIASTAVSGDRVQGMKRIWTHNGDKDYSAYLNFTNSFDLLSRKFELKFGGVERNKTRDNYYSAYSLDPTPGELYTNVNDAVLGFKTPDAALFSPDGNNYTFKENIAAGYVQGKWQLTDKLEALGGLRVENTSQNYNTQLPTSVPFKTGKITYTDFLPSAIFKYVLKENQNLRLSYYKALARPGFAELIPDGQQGDIFKESGNPSGLNHTTADNLDLRYELFPKNADEILVGVFYKKIHDPIEIATNVKNPLTSLKVGITELMLIPQNFGDATNYGFEFVYTKYFGPFGVVANYTYTKSKITSDKLMSYRNDAGQVMSKILSETRPLQGQSNHIGNLALLYKDPNAGLDVQVAFVYTGERIALVSPNYGLDYWQAPTVRLDFSVEKRLNKSFSIYGKANNLTNTPYVLELHQSYNDYLNAPGARPLNLQTDPDHKITVQKDYFKPSFLLGVRYKL